MDSGNSGSMYSSSGDDEEYHSRAADSFSGFLTHSPLHQPAPPPPFDHLSNYLQFQNSALNSNLFLPRVAAADLGSEGCGNIVTNSSFMAVYTPPTADPGNVPIAAAAETDAPVQIQTPATRNPKKRTRASRRAPTTVLTTDINNFRAMVQEFTGIPAPPFSSSSPFLRSRVDPFTTPSMRFANPAQPYCPRRPFTQEVQSPLPQQFLSSTAAAPQSSTSGPAPPINYHIPSPNSNLFKISDQNFSLQSNHRFSFSSSKPQDSFQIPTAIDQSSMKMRSGFDDFSLIHGCKVSATLSSLPNLVPSDQTQPRNEHDHDHNNDNTNNIDGYSWRNNDEINPDQPLRRLVNENYSTFSTNSANGAGNFNFTASSSSSAG